jgi:hypothetical protein
MNFEQFAQIYSYMMELYKKDPELTHIELIFNIKPVKSEKKSAIINIKTYKDGNTRQ